MFNAKVLAACAAALLALAPAAQAQTVDPAATTGVWLPPTSLGHLVLVQRNVSGTWTTIGTGMMDTASKVVTSAHLVSGVAVSLLRVVTPVLATDPAYAVANVNTTVVASIYNPSTGAGDCAVLRLASPLVFNPTVIGGTTVPAVGATVQAVGHVTYVAGVHPVQDKVSAATTVTITASPASGFPVEKGQFLAPLGTISPSASLTVYGLFSAAALVGQPQTFTRLSGFKAWIDSI
jgi:hypothetical protein